MVMSFRPSFLSSRAFSTRLNYKVTIIDKANKGEWVVDCAPDTYIIDAALDAGVDGKYITILLCSFFECSISTIAYFLCCLSTLAPYSCKAGSCNTCVGIVKSGTVDQVFIIHI